MIATQFDANLPTLRIDNGGEYLDRGFQAYINDHGIINQSQNS